MKPSLLMRHLETKHPTYKQRNISSSQRLSNSPNLNSCLISTNKANEAAIEASYRISYHIAKSGKIHTIAENLVFPCIKDTVECMFGEDHVQKIKNIPLSNSTVSPRIKDMSIDIEATINERIKKSLFFSIQVDESTDVSDLSISPVIVRYLNVNELEESLLLCYPLTKRCTGEDILNANQDYFCENKIDWAKCCDVCTDGGKSMSGCYKGLRGRIKIVAPHVTWSHCCIHRQSLAAKPLPDSLKEVLNQSVKVVNFIKANSTNTRLFKSLCGDMDSLHTTLLLHTEVRNLFQTVVLLDLKYMQEMAELSISATIATISMFYKVLLEERTLRGSREGVENGSFWWSRPFAFSYRSIWVVKKESAAGSPPLTSIDMCSHAWWGCFTAAHYVKPPDGFGQICFSGLLAFPYCYPNFKYPS
ncbi:Zinc finger BED domain-containing protein 5 [Araneus ventricosus]|uniref:Zinc finger BED domain-containing protein 5 n=1 Tax=Araneus ventricosus TaxID=182803 RepID=A0A4Y2KNA6_ARAVE|nr:Zinc finger BED domain-containing protein 5 [Araneus ventricosus]